VSGLLDSVNVASLGLMAAVTAMGGLGDRPLPISLLCSFILLIWFKVSSTWLIAGGGSSEFDEALMNPIVELD
jgi:hypothetical protein